MPDPKDLPQPENSGESAPQRPLSTAKEKLTVEMQGGPWAQKREIPLSFGENVSHVSTGPLRNTSARLLTPHDRKQPVPSVERI